jgi:hypothetical protein
MNTSALGEVVGVSRMKIPSQAADVCIIPHTVGLLEESRLLKASSSPSTEAAGKKKEEKLV